MTVKGLIEELQKYPEDSIVEVRSYGEYFNELTIHEYQNNVCIYVEYIDENGNYVN